MKKSLLCLGILVFSFSKSFATIKTWNGGASGSWSSAANWSPSGVPSTVSGDSIVFDGSLWATITITDVAVYTSAQAFGQFTAKNNVTLNLSGGSNTYLYFSGGIQINSASTVNIGASTTTLFVFGGNTTTAGTTLIAGTLNIQGNGAGFSTRCSYEPHSAFTANAVASVTGTLILSGAQAQITNANATNLVFANGSSFNITRNGGAVPTANFQNGSTINLTGASTSMVTISNSATYSGLIIWNCSSQAATLSGSSALILPSTSYTIDSLRIVNTNLGTVRLATNPNGFTIGHLEVQGGTLELSAPASATSTGSITTDFKITGGNVIGNATYTFDNLASYPMTLTVNGNFSMSGSSTFNFTNRPTGNLPGGAFLMNVKGNASQTAGTISSTSAFGSQNQINMNGTSLQNLQLSNIINTISLVITNSAGVSLQNDLVLPYYLNLQQGYLQLNSNNCTVTYPQIFQSINTPSPKVVTNGLGKLRVLNIPAGGFQWFYIGPNSSSYNPITIAPQASAATNSYYVRVETGNNPTGIFNTGKTVNRTWIINAASAITANTVDITNIQYDAADINGSCNPTGLMELGHFVSGAWSVDPVGITNTPIGSGPYSVGAFAPNSLDSAFVLGNQFSILALKKSLTLTATKVNTTALLNWNVSNIDNVKQFIVEHSGNGRQYAALHSLNATAAVGYSWQHMQLQPGIHYYRIKMTEADERVTYSNVSTVLNSNAGVKFVSIVPNIITNKSSAVVNAAKAGTASFIITDIAGKKLALFSVMLSPGENTVQLPVASLKAGLYQVALITDTDMQVQRFVKQ